MKIETTQAFIEAYYPNYSSCEKIARWNDLYKVLTNDYQGGDKASELADEFSSQEDVSAAFDLANADVLASAIEGFIEARKIDDEDEEATAPVHKYGCDVIKTLDIKLNSLFPEELENKIAFWTIPTYKDTKESMVENLISVTDLTLEENPNSFLNTRLNDKEKEILKEIVNECADFDCAYIRFIY